jgi:hypothetical protein
MMASRASCVLGQPVHRPRHRPQGGRECGGLAAHFLAQRREERLLERQHEDAGVANRLSLRRTRGREFGQCRTQARPFGRLQPIRIRAGGQRLAQQPKDLGGFLALLGVLDLGLGHPGVDDDSLVALECIQQQIGLGFHIFLVGDGMDARQCRAQAACKAGAS